MTVRRNRVVPVAEPVQEERRGIHRCHSCGVGLPMAPRQAVCSWCNGDPNHGKDGYFNDIIDEALATFAKGLPRATIRDMLVQDRKAGLPW